MKRREVSEREAKQLLSSTPQSTVSDLALPPRVRWRINHLNEVRFENIAFGGPIISGSLWRRGTVTASAFADVDLDSLRCEKVDFIDCSFENACFGKEYVGSVRDCTFVRCTFTRCRFDHVGFERSVFNESHLEDIRATRAMWRACTLENTSFSGTVGKTNFVATTFRRVDFSRLVLEDCAILDSPVADVLMPQKTECFAVELQPFLDAQKTLKGRVADESWEAYRKWAESYGRSRRNDFVIIGDAFLEFMVPRDRETVRGILYELRARGDE